MATAAYRERNREAIRIKERDRWAQKRHFREQTDHIRAVARRLHHKTRLKRRGLTPEDYDRMFADQHGLCAICHRPETRPDTRYGTPKRLSLDHCHRSGRNRELLCAACNKALGLFEENIEALACAIEYLRKHATTQATSTQRRLIQQNGGGVPQCAGRFGGNECP